MLLQAEKRKGGKQYNNIILLSDSECEYCGELEDQIQKLQEENTELLEENVYSP